MGGKTYLFEFWHQRSLVQTIIRALQDPAVASKMIWDPYKLYITINGKMIRVYGDFITGDIMWDQAVSSELIF